VKADSPPDFFAWDLKAFVRSVFGPPTYEAPVEGEPDWTVWQEAFRTTLVPGEDHDPELLLSHSAAFCRSAGTWMKPYSGKAFLNGSFQIFNHLTQVGEALFEQPVLFEVKTAFAASIPELYPQLAHWKDPDAEMALFGLWDSLLYGFKSGMLDLNNSELRNLQEAFLQSLSRQLDMDFELAQDSALHGLNHLAHPQGSHLISAWIERHPKLDDTRKGYALQCAAGKAL
jgi:hypothetical protein